MRRTVVKVSADKLYSLSFVAIPTSPGRDPSTCRRWKEEVIGTVTRLRSRDSEGGPVCS
jgi:hypothetical protein